MEKLLKGPARTLLSALPPRPASGVAAEQGHRNLTRAARDPLPREAQ